MRIYIYIYLLYRHRHISSSFTRHHPLCYSIHIAMYVYKYTLYYITLLFLCRSRFSARVYYIVYVLYYYSFVGLRFYSSRSVCSFVRPSHAYITPGLQRRRRGRIIHTTDVDARTGASVHEPGSVLTIIKPGPRVKNILDFSS